MPVSVKWHGCQPDFHIIKLSCTSIDTERGSYNEKFEGSYPFMILMMGKILYALHFFFKAIVCTFHETQKKKTGREIICWLNRLDTRASVN